MEIIMPRRIQLLLMLAVFALPLAAQLDRGTFTGTVTDPSGAFIPRVGITIENKATGARVVTASNEAGAYTMPNLPSGSYTIEFAAPSFKKLVRMGIELTSSRVIRIDASLEVGQVSESVSVTAETPRLQSETREVGTSITSQQLIDLPLSFSSGRSPETFAFSITPGVTGNTYTGHINGSPQFSKDVLLDGASATTFLGGDFSTGAVSVEAVGEMKIITSGMSAEFGRTGGGLFSFVMKSGTNQIHGSAFGLLRNEALNSNGFSNNFYGAKRPLDRKQDLGFSFGGPVYVPKVYNGRNRTFFYTTYERYRERSWGFGAPSRTVPIPDFYEGNFSRLLGTSTGQKDALGNGVARGAIYDPATFSQLSNGRWIGQMFPGNILPKSRISKIAQNVNALATKYYLPTVRDATGRFALINNATFLVNAGPVLDTHQFSTKVDRNINDKQKLSGSWTHGLRDRSTLADSGGLFAQGTTDGGPLSAVHSQRLSTNYVRAAHDTIITPSILNHATASFNWLHTVAMNVHADTDGAKALGIANLSTYGFPVINWGSGPAVGLTGIGDSLNATWNYTQFGFLDTVSFSKGHHFLKAGIDIRHNSLNYRPTQGGGFNFAARATAIPNETFAGNLTGYSMASYLLGIVDSASLADPAVLGGRRHYYALFLQDDFKISSRLTLQLGMRWEYQPPMFEVADRLSSWNPRKTDPASGLKGAYDFAGSCNGCTGRRYFGNPSLRDWGPRVGFAWRASKKTTVRGGYGIFYASDVFNTYFAVPLGKSQSVQFGGTYALNADPVTPWVGIFNWDNGFPTNRFDPASMNASWGNSNAPSMFDDNYGRSGYIQDWNLNIQRELWRKIVLDVGYVANKSTGLYNGSLSREPVARRGAHTIRPQSQQRGPQCLRCRRQRHRLSLPRLLRDGGRRHPAVPASVRDRHHRQLRCTAGFRQLPVAADHRQPPVRQRPHRLRELHLVEEHDQHAVRADRRQPRPAGLLQPQA